MNIAKKTICTALLLCCVIQCGNACTAQERRLAVVVGVNAYRANSGLPTLQHAANDATALGDTLQKTGFKVYQMTHEVARQPGQEDMAPNLDYIRDQIEGVLEFPNLGSKDAVLITLHGHGVQFDFVDDSGKKAPRFYFCPADATVSGLKTANDITARHNLLPLDELYAELANCKAATKLLIVDACRNDPTARSQFRESLASATLPKLPPPTGGTAAFFSCKANQRAVEDSTLKQGVFTHFLVKGLQGEADQPLANKPADGIVTFAELSAYVANNTYAHVFDKFKVRQSPELRGDYDLNLPLARIQTSRRPTAAGMKFVRIEAGSFQRGSESGEDDEKPVRPIQVSKSFYAASHEVTIGQVLQWLNSDDTQFRNQWIDLIDASCPVTRSDRGFVRNNSTRFAKSDDQPMQCISWFGAVAFCEWCSRQDSNFTYRLPTEAEWEYMARAGSATDFPWGNSLNGADANVAGRFPYGTAVKGPEREVTTNVGSYRPNSWGLFDTVGNVWEWCSDSYGKDYYANSPRNDPGGADSGAFRVLRGGSWDYKAIFARTASRHYTTPFSRYNYIGFRVVCD